MKSVIHGVSSDDDVVVAVESFLNLCMSQSWSESHIFVNVSFYGASSAADLVVVSEGL